MSQTWLLSMRNNPNQAILYIQRFLELQYEIFAFEMVCGSVYFLIFNKKGEQTRDLLSYEIN